MEHRLLHRSLETPGNNYERQSAIPQVRENLRNVEIDVIRSETNTSLRALHSSVDTLVDNSEFIESLEVSADEQLPLLESALQNLPNVPEHSEKRLAYQGAIALHKLAKITDNELTTMQAKSAAMLQIIDTFFLSLPNIVDQNMTVGHTTLGSIIAALGTARKQLETKPALVVMQELEAMLS